MKSVSVFLVVSVCVLVQVIDDVDRCCVRVSGCVQGTHPLTLPVLCCVWTMHLIALPLTGLGISVQKWVCTWE